MSAKITGHILVVDDQKNWREALSSLLMQEGHRVQTAASFEAASEKIPKGEFDLLILDVRLVDQDVFNIQGLELLRQVKALESAPRVIILTGYPESIREGSLERYGADALVLKVPSGSTFDSKSFKEQVQALLASAGGS